MLKKETQNKDKTIADIITSKINTIVSETITNYGLKITSIQVYYPLRENSTPTCEIQLETVLALKKVE